MVWFWHHLQHWIGIDSGSGIAYLFWSGFFGDVSIFVGLMVGLRHLNCHVKGCARIGKPVDGTPYRACYVHHPGHKSGKRNVSVDTIERAHTARRP